MARTPKGNNAFALAHGSRLAADSTHGVTCAFAGGCRVFDPNISKEHEGRWRCERHGGANNHARANAKDEEFRNGIPGAERRMRFARLRAKQRKAAVFTGHIPSFLDKPEPKPKPKKAKAAPKVQAKSQKQLRREAAMAELGLTEADLITAFGGN
tara:strand:+ start:707 stop:1171 length:465 start_codon:yes stop_codon:yes gene_type:complete